MASNNVVTYGLADLKKVALEVISPYWTPGTIFRLEGGLGAGKTTLVKQVLRAHGVKEPVLSPTFSYVNSYTVSPQSSVHHFDIYRIGSVSEFCAMGLDSYLQDPKDIVFIEWPGVIDSLLDSYGARVISIKLSYGAYPEEARDMVIAKGHCVSSVG
jgi:tRNA threonylcarbamoyladenosine biosynthesis protein TsaE